MKKIGLLFVIAGFLTAGYAGVQLFDAKKQTDENLALAEKIVAAKQPPRSEEREVASSPERTFSEGEVIGVLQLPALGEKLPIIEGTDEDELAQGVGHYSGTAFPGQKDQILLSGHRDTVFRRLGELRPGDELVVEMETGSFRYRIDETEIVGADDTSVIRSTAPDEVLTVSTCYPFGYIGNAPDRYIIYAKRVEE
ncbi:class D sortase [Bacillus marinisedimentorum]|uniref:class D sortase n=1 Tax=Bacillus marinisedimentorum TaxID=1821260 RepID=UPI0007DE7114|nr:class D sortase [Bacillus marinisedimentorum]